MNTPRAKQKLKPQPTITSPIVCQPHTSAGIMNTLRTRPYPLPPKLAPDPLHREGETSYSLQVRPGRSKSKDQVSCCMGEQRQGLSGTVEGEVENGEEMSSPAKTETPP